MPVLNFYHIGKQIPEGAVYIGRGGKGLTQSKFANPFKLSENEERGATLFRYKTWLWNECLRGNITKSDILSLDGKDLVCFCSPKPCHGDVIIELIMLKHMVNTLIIVFKNINVQRGTCDGYPQFVNQCCTGC